MEELGDIEILNDEKFPSLHEWKQNFNQISPLKDCIPPREKIHFTTFSWFTKYQQVHYFIIIYSIVLAPQISQPSKHF
ncbi:hypothetical protein Lal_00010257 [Lupinus albus]|nr:hypothetical protein Lal_00010257 [Lupinus albus]